MKDLTNIELIVIIINGNLLNGTKYFDSTKTETINVLEDLKLKLKELENQFDNSEVKKVISQVKNKLDSINFEES